MINDIVRNLIPHDIVFTVTTMLLAINTETLHGAGVIATRRAEFAADYEFRTYSIIFS